MDASFDPNPSFFKIMNGDLNLKKLGIPATFMKQYMSKEAISDKPAILKGPSGRVWKVKWKCSQGKAYLREGWEDFVKYYNLGDDEFLVFRYYGDRRFEVQIFGKNGLETSFSPKQTKNPEDFTSNNPHFVVRVNASAVKKTRILTIPKNFGMKHFPEHEIEVVLNNLKGKSWEVSCYTYFLGKHIFRGAGWNSFVSGNKIKKGDICIFELVAENEMLVHIFSK